MGLPYTYLKITFFTIKICIMDINVIELTRSLVQ